MKLLIAGSRSIKTFGIDRFIPTETTLIISGGAAGIDTIAEEYADRMRISKIILRPDYKTFGRSAPLKRNEEMVDMCDRVLVFWDGVSKGTKYTINFAKKVGKPIEIIMIE